MLTFQIAILWTIQPDHCVDSTPLKTKQSRMVSEETKQKDKERPKHHLLEAYFDPVPNVFDKL